MPDSALLITVFAVVGLVGLNALSYYSKKWMLLPDVIWVLLAGVAYGAVARGNTAVPELTLTPTLILWLFVPMLIFASGQKICLFHFRSVLAPSSIAATVGILISMGIFGSALHFAFGIAWLPALLFGVIISATDPLAVGALLHSNKAVGEDQLLLIEGESILNDGFVVTVFGILVAVLFGGESFMIGHSLASFGLHIIGALVVGAILGRGARWLLNIWHEEHFTLTTNITLAIAFGSFAIAESLHFSGILAVFAAALAYGYKPNPDNHNKHVMAHIWDYFEYIANAVLFFLLGASFFAQATWDGLSVGLVFASLALLFLSRFSALSILSPALKLDGQRLGRQTFWLLNFAGARGAVSVALILLLPDDFALKPTFLTLAFILIIFSLVAYPLAMKRLLRTP
jgi:CPA1 family monovalent cation:H+ antiporter